MSKPFRPPTQNQIDAYAALIVRFVVELAQAIFSFDPEHTRGRLHRAIQRTERGVELIVFMMALRLALPPQRAFNSRRNTPEGFVRRSKRTKFWLRYARVRLKHGNLYLRLARLVSVLADPARYVQRFVKRLNKGLRGSQLVAARPAALTLRADAPFALNYADSS